MAGTTHEERRAVAQRQECRDRHVERQPAVAEEGEGQAIETAEGEIGRRTSSSNSAQPQTPNAQVLFKVFR